MVKRQSLITILSLALLLLGLTGGPNLVSGAFVSAGAVNIAPLSITASAPLGAGFTYQGLLAREGNPVTGNTQLLQKETNA